MRAIKAFRDGPSLASAPAGERGPLDAWFESEPDAVSRADRRLRQLLDKQGILFGGQPLPVTIRPFCIPAAAERARGATSESVLAAIVALARIVRTDDDALAAIGFDRRARELLRGEGDEEVLPAFARGDALDVDDGVQFVEVNTDSPGMSVYSDVLQAAVIQVLREAGLHFVERWHSMTRIDRIHEALLRRYRARGGDKPDPMIAIVDWPNVKTRDEQRRLADELVARGCRAELFVPDELELRAGRLHGRGLEIDVVHRRVLFPEILAHPEATAALMRAVREGAVAMTNPLASYVAGNKGLLALAHDPTYTRRLSREQRNQLTRSIPYSMLVDDRARRLLWDSPRVEWVIKSSFGSSGSHVVLGSAVTLEEWHAAIDATRVGCWIAQRAVDIPMFGLPHLGDGKCRMRPYWANWNPWLIDGAYAGAMVRCSMARVISISARGALAACYSW